MKHKKLIVILIIISLVIIAVFYFSNLKSKENEKQGFQQMKEHVIKNNQQQGQKTSTLKSNSQIESSLVEKVEPHAGYYLEELYVQENQYVTKGTNLLKYSNGKYLEAPYDCCITELQLPGKSEKFLNSHYIQIESNNMLVVTMNIDEEKINNIELGSEVEIKVTSVDSTYTGYITHIASVGNNGKFETTIEFENDGKVKIGMTASVEITYTESVSTENINAEKTNAESENAENVN